MFPSIYHLLHYLFGIEAPVLKVFQTFGFFVALAFIAAYWAFTEEFKRKEKGGYIHARKQTITVGEGISAGELIGNALFGFVIGYKIVDAALNFNLLVQDTQSFLISTRGNFLGGVVVAALFAYWAYYENKKQRLPQPKQQEVTVHPHELMSSILLWAAIWGFAGAKLFNALENWDDFMRDPIGMLVGLSGLTFYGGLICGGLAVLYIANKNGVKSLNMLDIGAAGVMLAYAVGRIGCQMSGDGDWGISNTAPKPGWLSWAPDWMWAFKYPHNVSEMDPGNRIANCVGKYCNELTLPAYPTPFYETIMGLILFGILWSIRTKVKAPGVLFGIYMIFAGVERFLIELIRVNTRYHVAGISFTQAELISVLLVIGGSFLIYNGQRKYKGVPVNA
ncbi:diacylglyceryl transferase [Mucilaginibacter pallidiroseus]|uniref:Diacylglyceryl transferase n=1 Tax=Mucilaginibacter pallidiroseus TaxID=2599295 RepID=A0A563UJ41_9SPHI|nr:prolipoprotein diacylglyceryl transferase family protein [Mucilaginibacter pallidiroseus]TWR31323.1 diacylglyceryl transferase [Mucilaginibacter pallidiroseus]